MLFQAVRAEAGVVIIMTEAAAAMRQVTLAFLVLDQPEISRPILATPMCSFTILRHKSPYSPKMLVNSW